MGGAGPKGSGALGPHVERCALPALGAPAQREAGESAGLRARWLEDSRHLRRSSAVPPVRTLWAIPARGASRSPTPDASFEIKSHGWDRESQLWGNTST